MNTTMALTRNGSRFLTQKQARFVCALLERKSKAVAYRTAYGHNISSHDACIRGCRIAKSPTVQAALAEAEKGDFSGLTICREEAEILALRKIANDPSVPSYVKFGALQAILDHRRANPEPEPPKKAPTIDELERFLQAECGQKPAAGHRRNAFDELDEI